MVDLSTILGGAGGLTLFAVVQQAIKYALEERRKTAEEKRAEAREPIVERQSILGIADQATVIQQRTIAALQERLDQVTLEVSTLRAENTELRAQMKDKTAQIKDLYETIGQLEDENRKHPGRRQAAPPP